MNFSLWHNAREEDRQREEIGSKWNSGVNTAIMFNGQMRQSMAGQFGHQSRTRERLRYDNDFRDTRSYEVWKHSNYWSNSLRNSSIFWSFGMTTKRCKFRRSNSKWIYSEKWLRKLRCFSHWLDVSIHWNWPLALAIHKHTHLCAQKIGELWFGGVSSFSNYRSRKLKLNYGESISHVEKTVFRLLCCRHRYRGYSRSLVSPMLFIRHHPLKSSEHRSEYQTTPSNTMDNLNARQLDSFALWWWCGCLVSPSVASRSPSLSLSSLTSFYASEAVRTHMPQKTNDDETKNGQHKRTSERQKKQCAFCVLERCEGIIIMQQGRAHEFFGSGQA